MTFLRFVFGCCVATGLFCGSTALYLLVVLRHLQLLPVLAGLGVIPATIVAVYSYRALRTQELPKIEVVVINEPAQETIVIR
ncbi:MAG: hypothetical protein K1X67_15150 [Fimbriimonadaceae bacterium]|nr:hypothetical protein [Fimbriimonadaceae bacterium]